MSGKKSYKFNAGKYEGKTFKWVFDNDLKYFRSFAKRKGYAELSDAAKKSFNQYLATSALLPEKLKSKEVSKDLDKDILQQAMDIYFESGNYFKAKTWLSENKLAKGRSSEYLGVLKQIYSEALEGEKKSLIELHINRYEAMQNKLLDTEIDSDGEHYVKRLSNVLNKAVDVMIAKEKMMGLHTKVFKVELNNYYEQQKSIDVSNLDFTKLSAEEQNELLTIFGNIDSNKEGFAVITGSNKRDDIVEDVDFEDVIEAPVADSPVEAEPLSPKPVGAQTLHDVKRSIAKAVEQKMKDKLASKGKKL